VGPEADTSVTCPNCGENVPDDKVAGGICVVCWDALPSELIAVK
jgi:transposase